MKRLLVSLTLLAALLLFKISSAVPLITGVTTQPSTKSVSDTATRLVTLLREDKFIVRGIIDHQKIAQSLGHSIPPNQEILAGHPDFDYTMISNNPQAALFVPLTLVVWQNGDHKVYVSYWDPKADILPMLDMRKSEAIDAARAMSARLAKIVALAVKPN